MNWSLTRIPVWLGSTLTLAIPVTSTVLAWLFIDEQVRAVQFGGMGVVIVALGLIVVRTTRPPTEVDDVAPAEAAGPVEPHELSGAAAATSPVAPLEPVAPATPATPGGRS
jgi:hypothetical protein